MNNKTQEALKAAKEFITHVDYPPYDYRNLLDAIEEALAQPAQEPVTWMRSALDNARDVCKYLDHDMIKEAKAHTKFFWDDIEKIKEPDTHPAPSWQGLTSEEIRSLDLDNDVISVIFQTEKLLKEKNHGY